MEEQKEGERRGEEGRGGGERGGGRKGEIPRRDGGGMEEMGKINNIFFSFVLSLVENTH